MGAVQGSNLNTDSPGGIATSGYWADAGDGGGSKWFHYQRVVDGGHATIGAKTDTGSTVTDGTAASAIALLKGIGSRLASIVTALGSAATGLGKAEDAAHSSGDVGVMALAVRRDTSAASSGTTGDYEPLQTDSGGRLRTLMKRDSTDTLSKAVNTALAASLVVKASAGVLHSIVGYVASGESGWIQVHDATSAPADTAVPKMAYYVAAATAHVPVNIPLPGDVCATGVTLTWSTTGPTKTAGASKMMVAAYYE